MDAPTLVARLRSLADEIERNPDLAGAMNDDYRFDVQLSEGIVSEAWFYEMTRGGDRFEVKHDRRSADTGNLFIEFQHDPGGRGLWVPCGIATTEADCWIATIGDPVPHAFVGLDIDRLKGLARAERQRGKVATQPNGSCPTRGVLVPLALALGLRRL